MRYSHPFRNSLVNAKSYQNIFSLTIPSHLPSKHSIIFSPTLFLNFLKSTQIMLTIDLSHNLIEDGCVQEIEKFVIMPANPPIDEINLSFNKFSKKISWRLFLGNMKYNKYHTYLNFIIYPVPINPDIFPESPIQYPLPAPMINFNIHSALVEEFEQ